jgi:hypothetical protein
MKSRATMARELVEVLHGLREQADWWADEIAEGRCPVGSEGEPRTVTSLLAPYLERVATLEGMNALVAHRKALALTRF